MRNLPDIGRFVRFDPQRFVTGSLANQIRVLVQRMKMRGYEPWKILLSRGLRDALRLEMQGKLREYIFHDQGDLFLGLPIKVDDTVNEPIILIKPKLRKEPLDGGKSTPERVLWEHARADH